MLPDVFTLRLIPLTYMYACMLMPCAKSLQPFVVPGPVTFTLFWSRLVGASSLDSFKERLHQIDVQKLGVTDRSV